MPAQPLAVPASSSRPSPWQAFFAPRRLALIGATDRPGSVGRALLENLGSFPGEVFPIHASKLEILGRPAWPHLRALPEPVDLAVIATPAIHMPDVIRECVAAGVRAALIISAGFKETGEAGRLLEQRVLEAAREGELRLIGPNCLGLMIPHAGLNATFATAMALPGRVAFLSQSGALCTAILDWSFRQRVGFSAFVSVGSMLDVGWGDLIRHFGDDPHTQSIVIYMESIGDASAFLDAAREVAGRKPIVVIKVGRTAAAAKAAASHTGAMTGSDDVFDAALQQVGVLRVDRIEQLFDMAEVLAKQPLPHGPRLSIVTNAGGPGALATDALVRQGGQLAALSESTASQLNACLPAAWSHGNPVDVLGDAPPQRYEEAFQAVLAEPECDGLLAILTPQAMTDPLGVAQRLIALTAGTSKPVLASWMGGAAMDSARQALNAAGIPTYDYPDEAAEAFQFMWRRHERLQCLQEAQRRVDTADPPLFTCQSYLRDLLSRGRQSLTEVEAKRVLELAGLSVWETHAAGSEEEAVARAQELGFPVVVKLQSRTLTHKTDVGGVCLNLQNDDAVRLAWQALQRRIPPADFEGVSVQRLCVAAGTELICGASLDPSFGPVLLVGAGGIWVEMLQDRVLMLPPLPRSHALERLRQTRIFRALQGLRGQQPAKLEAVVEVLVRLGDLMLACPEIAELDINPLLATPEAALILDARIILRRT